MSVTIKGDNMFDAYIVNRIRDCQTEHVKFYNISFDCKTIEDAEGRIFTNGEPGRQKGKWIYEPGHIPKCSACGIYSDDADRGYDNFCPNCGANMRKEEE